MAHAWEPFGWGVAPGTVVKQVLDVGNLDVVLTKIGEALGRLGARLGSLESRVDAHDGLITGLQGSVDGLLAFRERIEGMIASGALGGGAPAAAPGVALSSPAAVAPAAGGADAAELAALRAACDAMAARLAALEGGAAARQAAAWRARAEALRARQRGLGAATEAAAAKVRAWGSVVEGVVARRGEAAGVEAALTEYAHMDAAIMPLPRELETARAIAAEELAALEMETAAGGDGGGALLAELRAAAGPLGAGIGAVSAAAEAGRAALLHACADAANAARAGFADLALKAAMMDVDVRAGEFQTRVADLRGRLGEVSDALVPQGFITEGSPGFGGGGGGGGGGSVGGGGGSSGRPGTPDTSSAARPTSAAAPSPGDSGAKHGGGSDLTASLDAITTRLGKTESTTGRLSADAGAVRAEVETIKGVLARLDKELMELRASAARASRTGSVSDMKDASGAISAVSEHQVCVCVCVCVGGGGRLENACCWWTTHAYIENRHNSRSLSPRWTPR